MIDQYQSRSYLGFQIQRGRGIVMDCLFVYLSFFLNPQPPNYGREGPEAKYHHPDPKVATALNIRLLNQIYHS